MKYGYYLLDIFSLGLEIPNVSVGESRPELCYILAFCKIQRRIKPAYTEDCFVSKIQVGDGKGTNNECRYFISEAAIVSNKSCQTSHTLSNVSK